MHWELSVWIKIEEYDENDEIFLEKQSRDNYNQFCNNDLLYFNTSYYGSKRVEADSEPSQISRLEFFSYFRKTLHLRCLAGFWRHFWRTFLRHLRHFLSIQEWTKQNLWKVAFKNIKWYGLLKQTIPLQIF